jgi:carboxyl-terminal processing protease
LKSFAENSAKQVENLLEKINADPECKGMILDLRNNPGGLLEASVEISGLFLPKNSLVATSRNNQNKLIRTDVTLREPVLNRTIHVFVLINKFTASASEILAGALCHHSEQLSKANAQPYPIVTLIGTTTHGKGSVQVVIPLSNGCALSLTEMLYFLADNTSIQAKGVEPDIMLTQKYPPNRERKWLEELFGQEKSLKRHITAEEVSDIINQKDPKLATEQDKKTSKTIQLIENKMESEAEFTQENHSTAENTKQDKEADLAKNKKRAKPEELIASDYQVQTCINMINTLGLAKQCGAPGLNKREGTLDFLKKNFVYDDNLKVSRIK